MFVRHVSLLFSLVAVIDCGLAPAQEVTFERDVLPILKAHCLECHGAESQESLLRLDSMTAALTGGDSGEPVIVPGDSARSHLMERVTSSDSKLRMPPDAEPLPPEQLVVLRKWIDSQSLWLDAGNEIAHKKSRHWSFQPLVRPKLPVSDGVTSLHPIDAYIKEELDAVGLGMSPPAARQRLIRRLYLVMHGLPPTPDQVAEFEQDEHPRAWEKLVDRVLESPRYGERWATHWLDIIRFGETNGFETNRERPNSFPFRDWVIDAFNSDKPYDHFVKQQIAGDALGEPIGTGFLVAGPNDIVKGQDPLLGLLQRQDELTDMVNATGTAFLGLSTGCARCHNHKFDPISQSDFYALQAVFAGVEHGETDLPRPPSVQLQVRDLDNKLAQLHAGLAIYASERGWREPVNARENNETFSAIDAKFIRFTIKDTNASEPCIDELQAFAGEENVALASRGAIATSSGNFVHPLHKLEHVNDGQFGNAHSWICSQVAGGWVQIQFPQVYKLDRIVWGRDRTGRFADRVATDYRLESSLDGITWTLVTSSAERHPFADGKRVAITYDLKSLPEAEATKARALLTEVELLEKQKAELAGATKVYAGIFHQPGATFRLYRGDPTAPREQVRPGGIESLYHIPLDENASDPQRRLALANWIADPINPLTPRVFVNRLWQFHFGSGIVDTPSDLGANGTLPSHPELLDLLASELDTSGWSIKQMHRILLTSKTWQQDSRPREDGLRIDAASRLLWRFPPRRLEAEGIRDSILMVSGKLDLKMAGPGFSAFEVALENVRHYFPKQDYGPADWRRMIYMTKVRQEKDSTFGVFDCPDGSQVAPQRSRSTTPLQALNLLNSRFVLQQAEFLASRLEHEQETSEAKVNEAYALCFGRSASPSELLEAQEFIAQFGLVEFSRALLNANEFIFIP